MQNLISFIYNSREYFILLIALLVSLILISNNDNNQVRAMRGNVLDVFQIIQKPLYHIADLNVVRKENKKIRQKNIDLSILISNLNEAKLENERLRLLLDFKSNVEKFNPVTSEVIGFNTSTYGNTIILDAGEEKGVIKNAPVVNSKGIVGKIIDVGQYSSIAQLLNDRNFSISVTINPVGANGILHGDRGLSDLKEVPKGLLVAVGDTVVTSGFSDIYPMGLMVGVVTSVNEKPEHFFKEIKVEPSVSMSKLKEVFILISAIDTQKEEFIENK